MPRISARLLNAVKMVERVGLGPTLVGLKGRCATLTLALHGNSITLLDFCSPTNVVISTPNNAFRNFALYCLPSTGHHSANLFEFLSSDMVELQHHNICFSAINAWMHSQVRHESLLILCDLFSTTYITCRLVRFFVRCIPYLLICTSVLWFIRRHLFPPFENWWTARDSNPDQIG